jgi:hypothetical protein
MDFKSLLPIIALLFAIVSFGLSFTLTRRSAVSGIKPVLVFIYDGEKGWILTNIGNGPALNIVVAQKRVNGNWFNPVRVPPISKGSEFRLLWLGHVNDTGLGATYTDFQNRKYSSTCLNDLSRVYSGDKFPEWEEHEIGRHWNHPFSVG